MTKNKTLTTPLDSSNPKEDTTLNEKKKAFVDSQIELGLADIAMGEVGNAHTFITNLLKD